MVWDSFQFRTAKLIGPAYIGIRMYGIYGITTKDLRYLAYDLATKNNILNRNSKTQKSAGLNNCSSSIHRAAVKESIY